MELAKVHSECLEGATWLSDNQVKNAIAPLEVIRCLAKVAPNSVLVGTYGVVGWMRKPRATQTVEALVALGLHRTATNSLLRAFPQLEVGRQEAATDLHDRETRTVAVRIWKPVEPRFRQALRRTYLVRCQGRSCRVPSLEMALVLTYVPMVASWCDVADSYQHAHDFIRMAKVNPDIDRKRLAVIAQATCPENRDDLLEKIRVIQAGEDFHL